MEAGYRFHYPFIYELNVTGGQPESSPCFYPFTACGEHAVLQYLKMYWI